MIEDVLGILIGFAYVMLTFSLIVTTAVEALQGMLKVRRYNLIEGFKVFFASDYFMDSLVNKEAKTLLTEPKSLAKELYQKCDLNRAVNLDWWSKFKAFVGRFIGPQADQVSIEDLYAYIEDKLEGIEGAKMEKMETFKRKFERFENYLIERFKYYIKTISIVVTVMVVVLFQLDSIALLKTLSENAEWRNQLIGKSDTIVVAAEQNDDSTLKKETQQSQEVGAQDSNAKPSAGASQGTTTTGKEGNSATETTLLNAEKLHLKLKQSNTDMEAGKGLYAFDFLTFADIDFRKPDASYYFRAEGEVIWDHIVGILISIIFVSLGSEFWFDSLKSLITVKRRITTTKKDQAASVSTQ